MFAASFSEVNFPTSHPLWSGMLNTSSPVTRRLLSGADVVLAVGANIFSSFLYVDVPLLDPTSKLVHLDSATSEVEKNYPTEIGIFSDPATGLAELADALDQDMSGPAKEAAATRMAELGERRRRAREEYQERLRQKWDNSPIAVERMMHELAAAVPPGTIVADEAVTSRPCHDAGVRLRRTGNLLRHPRRRTGVGDAGSPGIEAGQARAPGAGRGG